jgi:divalent metal cation (Fe/Co/Zn/Cd) transporter
MAILGFILCFCVLSYVLLASCVVIFGVGFSIGMGGGKHWHYILPFVALLVDLYLFWLLFENSPFKVTML